MAKQVSIGSLKKGFGLNINKSERLIVSLLSETSRMIEPAIVKGTRISDPSLQEKLDHALKPKGDRERALLVRLSCEAVGGKFADIIPAAVAIELFHFSTLIIDDILDDAPLRGNYKTVQAAYGYKNALVVGELLNSLALLVLTGLSDYDNNGHKLLKVTQLFKETQKNLYEGQYLDLSFEHQEDISKSQYVDMISKTTASLIKCSLITGAILGGGDKSQIESLTKYGESLGIAFQIRDDLVEIIGEPKIIGKQLGGDIRQGKMRLPLIHALSNTKGLEHQFLKKAVRNKSLTKDDTVNCIEILINNGSIEYSKNVINNFCQEAIRQLKPLLDSEAKCALAAFAEVITLSW